MPLATSLGIGLVNIVVTEFIRWQEIKMRDAAWKPGPETKDEFLTYVASDTTEKIEAEVAAEFGKVWADRRPPPAPPVV